MRLVLFVLCLFGISAPVVAQTPSPSKVAVTVLTLDALRQGQAAYALATLGAIDDRRGGLTVSPEILPPALLSSCLEDRMDHDLDYCVRYYVTRAELPADGPPVVVVAFDDEPGDGSRGFGGETLRVTCFGRGVVAADPEAQDTWLWPGAARMHGVRDMQRDEEALAACIAAAASEPWTGLRQPDPS